MGSRTASRVPARSSTLTDLAIVAGFAGIALAALGRADKKVNLDLALKCWKNNVCNTGTGGKLTVAYIEQFGERKANFLYTA